MTSINTTPTSESERIAVSIAEAARLTGIGRSTLYLAMGSGALKSVKIGKRRLISIDALRAWLQAHEAVA